MLARTLAARSCDVVFFFQAEDGIRDHCVTGVQTCALPIWYAFWPAPPSGASDFLLKSAIAAASKSPPTTAHRPPPSHAATGRLAHGPTSVSDEIGRASCRERVEIAVVAEA